MEVMLRYTRGLFAPMQITYLRFLIGGIALIPFAIASLKKHGARLKAGDLAYFALTGFMCVAFSMVMYQMAILYSSASFVAVSGVATSERTAARCTRVPSHHGLTPWGSFPTLGCAGPRG